MKNFKTPLIIILVIAVLAFIKIKFLSAPTPAPLIAGKNAAAPSTLVNVYVASTRELNNSVFVTGNLIANEEVILMPEISGKIISLPIVEGSVVSKGQLLVKINDADLQAQLKKALSSVKVTQDKLNRLKQLLSINGVSQEEVDAAQSMLDGFQADADYTNVQIAKCEIYAPFNGVIGLRSVSEGSFVTPSTRIAAIQQLNPIKIDLSVPEKYADVIEKDDVLEFSVSENKEKHAAKVYAIEPKIDPVTRTLQLRALADNKDGKLFPGAFAKIQLPLKKINDAIMIPTEAIVPVMKGKSVFICKNGKASQVTVETGVRTDSTVQITKGIEKGDSVITTGLMQIKTGASLKVIKEKK